VLVSMIAAIVAAVFYGVASVMQAIAVRAASNRQPDDTTSGGVDPGLVVRMLHQWRFVASICLDALGFLAQLVALQKLPLFLVQAFVASNLAVTAVVASWLIGVTLSWREWAAAKLNEPYRTTALGLVAGFGFGVLSIAARVLDGFAPLQLARDPAAYAIAAAGIISFMFYATALEGGSVTVATAAVVLAETIPPAIIGVVFLGDQTRPGLAGVAWLGFFIAVTSAVMLARFGEAHHSEDVALADAVARRQANAGPAAAELLSWWPVDLQLFPALTNGALPDTAVPETTGVS